MVTLHSSLLLPEGRVLISAPVRWMSLEICLVSHDRFAVELSPCHCLDDCANARFEGYCDLLKLRMLVWKRRAAKRHRANRKKSQNAVCGNFFCQVFSAKPLSNGDLRMRGRRHFYHIIFLPSWSWLGIIKSPQFLDINLECRHLPRDFHQQWMLFWKFSLHFGHILFFFGGVRSSDFLHLWIFSTLHATKNRWKTNEKNESQRKPTEKPMKTNDEQKQWQNKPKHMNDCLKSRRKRTNEEKHWKPQKKRMNNQIRTNKKTMREIRVTTNERIKKPTQNQMKGKEKQH